MDMESAFSDARGARRLTRPILDAVINGDEAAFRHALFWTGAMANPPLTNTIDADVAAALEYGFVPPYAGYLTFSLAELCMRHDRLAFLRIAIEAVNEEFAERMRMGLAPPGDAKALLTAHMRSLGTYDYPGKRIETFVQIALRTKLAQSAPLIVLAWEYLPEDTEAEVLGAELLVPFHQTDPFLIQTRMMMRTHEVLKGTSYNLGGAAVEPVDPPQVPDTGAVRRNRRADL